MKLIIETKDGRKVSCYYSWSEALERIEHLNLHADKVKDWWLEK